MRRNFSNQCDIFTSRKTRNEIVELEYESHAVAAKSGQRVLIGKSQVPPSVNQRSHRRHIQPPEQIKQGRLSAPRGPEQNHELTRKQIQIHPIERVHFAPRAAVHLLKRAHLKKRFPLCPHIFARIGSTHEPSTPHTGSLPVKNLRRGLLAFVHKDRDLLRPRLDLLNKLIILTHKIRRGFVERVPSHHAPGISRVRKMKLVRGVHD